MTEKSVCYWIVGYKNKTQPPHVIFDLHAECGDVLKRYSQELPIQCDYMRAAAAAAADFAARNGAGSISYDPDSTEAFCYC